MKRANRNLVLLCAAFATLWTGGKSVLRADPPAPVLTEPAYQELRRLSRSLDERAQRASGEAQRKDSWISRREQGLLRSIVEFAASVHRFDERLATYRPAPWPVEEELQSLARTAQDVRDRVRRSRFADSRASNDWNEIAGTLDQMSQVSRSRDGLIAPPPGQPGRDEYGERRGPPDSRDSRELAGLARELEDRASRAYGIAQRVAGEGPYRREFFRSIRDLHDRAVALRRSIESGASGRAQVRAEAGRLLQDARGTDENMRRGRAFRDVWPDWQAAMKTLERILSSTGG